MRRGSEGGTTDSDEKYAHCELDDKVHLKIRGHRTVDVIQKSDKFLMSMTRFALSNDFTGSGIERCKQRRCAMAFRTTL